MSDAIIFNQLSVTLEIEGGIKKVRRKIRRVFPATLVNETKRAFISQP